MIDRNLNKSVLFVSPNFAGHLNKTTLIAKHYQKIGYEVNYLITGKADWFKNQFNFEFYTSTVRSVGTKVIQNENNLQDNYENESLAVNIRNRISELVQVIDKVNPTLVFLDEFCSTDYALVYSRLKHTQCIVLVHTLPNEPDLMTPPLESMSLPSYFTGVKWLYKRTTVYIKDFYYSLTEPTTSVHSVWKHLKMSGSSTPDYTFYSTRSPVYKNLERWYLSAQEFDFDTRNLNPKSRYLGPTVDFERQEAVIPRVEMFLKKVESTPESKLIYCGLGTVIRSYILDEQLVQFYESLNEITRKRPDWHILVSVPQSLFAVIKPASMNIMFVEFVPQLKVLPKADVFITHGGGSVLEAIYFGVPMLCIPPARKFDYFGNAARIKYHGLGLKTEFDATTCQLEGDIEELLTNPFHRKLCLRLSGTFKQKYGPGYLEGLDLPNP
jgi:UDP:flavonoid glycosyltransferase YjiC (YdhE family)